MFVGAHVDAVALGTLYSIDIRLGEVVATEKELREDFGLRGRRWGVARAEG